MKKALSLLLFIAIFNYSFAQTASDIGKIALSIVVPETDKELNDTQLKNLQTKVTQIVTNSGLAANSYDNQFVIYPVLTLNETNVVEGGMENITVVSAEFSLYIKQPSTGIIFSSVIKDIKGSGKNQQAAVSNLISKVNSRDTSFKSFIETGKSEILKYYANNCNSIVLKADNLIKLKEYEQAIAVLLSVPEEIAECNKRVQEKAVLALKLYEEANCKELILKAKTAIASREYERAGEYIVNVSSESSCYKEATALAANIESKLTAEEQRKWNFMKERYRSEQELEKTRINAVKEVAKAYYESQWSPVTYNMIVL